MKIKASSNSAKLSRERMFAADAITRHQDKDGMIPTFFIGENCEHGSFNYWTNCQIHTTGILSELASLTEAEGIE